MEKCKAKEMKRAGNKATVKKLTDFAGFGQKTSQTDEEKEDGTHGNDDDVYDVEQDGSLYDLPASDV